MKYCDDYAALLDLYADGELSPEEMARVQEHLDTCPGCRAYVDDALALRAAFPDVEDTPVPDGFADGVMAAVRARSAPKAAQAAPRKRKAPWPRVLVPLAACCAIVVLLQRFPVSGNSKNASMDTAETAEAFITAADTAAEAACEEETVEEPAASQDARISAGETASTAPAAAEAPSAAESSASADKSVQPQDGAPSAVIATASFSPALTLTAEEAGALLDAYTPVQETADTRCYELTADEFDALLTALAESGAALPETQAAGAETVLVAVQK